MNIIKTLNILSAHLVCHWLWFSLSPCFQIGRNEEDAHICRVFCEELEIPFYRFSPTVEEVVGTAETNNLKICEAIIRYIKDK